MRVRWFTAVDKTLQRRIDCYLTIQREPHFLQFLAQALIVVTT
jgi:hypothetical protein